MSSTASNHLLHLDASILGEQSVSRALSASVVAKLTRARPELVVTYRDLASRPLPHLSGATLAASRSADAPQDAAVQADVALGNAVLDEFIAADILVVGLGFYNFGVPSQLKAWVDRIAVAGKTFRYTATGAEGLCGGKRVILAIARGGYYGPGSPMASFEHAETYLRQVFGFVGITDVDVVVAEGLAVGPDGREAGLQKAQGDVAALSA